MSNDVQQVVVHCIRAGKLLASIPLGIPNTLDDSKVRRPSRTELIESAKSSLTDLGMAGPPYEGIEFEIEYGE